MNRARLSRILPLILLVAAAVWAARAADQRGGTAPVTASGAYAVTFHVNTPTTVHDGAMILCKVRIAPRLPIFENLTRDAVPAESLPGLSTVAGSSATCSAHLPFSFAVSDLQNGAVLSYEIDAYSTAGLAFVRTQQGIAVPYPLAGNTASLRLDVNF